MARKSLPAEPRRPVVKRTRSALRQRAEALARVSRADVAGLSGEEAQRLVQELQVHQIELELQNQELREAQLHLAESRDRYSDLYEFAPVGYLSVGADGVIREANLTAAGMLARERALLVQRKLSTFVAAQSQDTLHRHWHAALESKRPERCELRMRQPGGPDLDVLVEILPRAGAAEAGAAAETAELRVTLSDISERRRAEDALRRLNESLERQVAERTQTLTERERALAAILSAAPDAVITFDERCRITAVNPAAEHMFGYRAGELVGQNISLLLPQAGATKAAGDLRQHLNGELSWSGNAVREVAARRKDGADFPGDLAIGEAEPGHLFTAILRDISDRKQLQRHVLEISDAEQRRLGQELHDGVCQELTSLALISGVLLESIAGKPPGEATWILTEVEHARLRKIMLRLAEGVHQANRHVRDLSRGIMPVEIEAGALHYALAELAATANLQQTVACTFHASGERPLADAATATHLYRIAQEALHNALRHAGATTVRIALVGDADQIVLEVADNGVGFKPGELGGAITASRGMGLRTMQYRAAMIGAALAIQAEPGGGTILRCLVPSRR